MAGAVIWYITMFACAASFLGIGIYALRIEKPMWFWSGSEVKAEEISDVKAYNRENARMWMLYSLWYWAAGILWHWSTAAAIWILMASCSVGIAILIASYMKIAKKYKVS